MLIDVITNYCNNMYTQKVKCSNCTYGDNCPGDCGICLHYIHTPEVAPTPRHYDCPNMANYYVCKYSYKFTSELIYPLLKFVCLQKEKQLKVMSIGCGPCTDLFALDYLHTIGIFQFDSLEYVGIDSSDSVWNHIYEQIKQVYPHAYFVGDDIADYMSAIQRSQWIPDLVVFQYVLSDMQKKHSDSQLKQFLHDFSYYFNQKMRDGSCIIINDTNLSAKYGNGGRDLFDALLELLESIQYKQLHFKNNNKPRHFEYGSEHITNELVISPSEELDEYNPYTACSSAQLIIRKVLT